MSTRPMTREAAREYGRECEEECAPECTPEYVARYAFQEASDDGYPKRLAFVAARAAEKARKEADCG